MTNISLDTNLSEKHREKIKSMHDEKIKINRHKLKHFGGAYDTDDHGFIYDENFTFTPSYLPGKDYLCGSKNIGENLGRFCREMPAYIFKDSALAGAWYGRFQHFVKIEMPPEVIPERIRHTHEEYHMWANGIGGMNHMSPDITIGLREGLGGLLQKIRYYRDFNRPADAGFYDGEEALVQGMMDYMKNLADKAKFLGEQAGSSEEKEHYQTIERICRKLITDKPETFREACQFIALFQSVDRTYFLGGALGPLDEILRPYYEKDIQNGLLTDEEAVWILASLFFNDTHYSQIGGRTPDGSRDLTSRISFLILEAAHRLAIPYNLAIRVYDGMNEGLLRKALAYTLECGTGPCYSLSKGIEEGFMKQGHPAALARMRAKVGCNWVALPGIEYPLQDVTRVNMGWAFVKALQDTEKEEKPNLNFLWQRFEDHLKRMVECIKEGYDVHYENVSQYTPEIVLNLFCHGPIERGLNAAEGGVDILNLNIDGVALATVADSFAAIEQRVIHEKRLDWKELFEALRVDYEGKENIRLMLKNIPRFGSPDSLAKDWAEKISRLYTNLVIDSPTPKHHLKVIPGLFSHGDVYAHGKDLPATPNGRKFGEAVSHSSEPDPGFANGIMSFSPTLKATAVANVQPGYGNSAPLHLDIDTQMLSGEKGVDILAALIHAHEQMGGTLINLNCLSKERLLRAHADPESEPDLVVRVTGYSAFFASLSKEYRQQVVDRYLTVG